MLGECLEFGDSANSRVIHSGRCCKGLGAAAARTDLRLQGAKMVGLPATASSGSALEPGLKTRCRCHAIHFGRRTFLQPKGVQTYGRTDAHAFGLTEVRTFVSKTSFFVGLELIIPLMALRVLTVCRSR